jgi:predicted transcriptional regulator
LLLRFSKWTSFQNGCQYKIKINCEKFKNEKISMEMDIYREKDMLQHMVPILVCYGGHYESKMAAKIQNSSDLRKIWIWEPWGGVMSAIALQWQF